jgi:hypothetical protein
MSLRYCILVIGLFVLLFLSSAGGSVAVAQQGNDDQGSAATPPMSMAPAANSSSKIATLVRQLNLKIYEAATGNLSLCGGDAFCIKYASLIQSWRCSSDVCDGTDKNKKLINCLGGDSAKYSEEEQSKLYSSGCSLIKSPGPGTRRSFSADFPDLGNENYLVEFGAYLLALKGSDTSCEDYIKSYVGPYGPKWNFEWYRAMSGCRILSNASTRELEEKYYYTWFGVLRGSGRCSDIYITEMRKACSAPGATSPVPNYGR